MSTNSVPTERQAATPGGEEYHARSGVIIGDVAKKSESSSALGRFIPLVH